MRPACFKTQHNKTSFPKTLIDFLKRGISIAGNLLGIGAATHQKGTDNSTATPVGTHKRARSSGEDNDVYHPERIKVRKTDRLALLAAAFSSPSTPAPAPAPALVPAPAICT
ncbi:hypothetical protein DFQ27_009212 [Actinomortierella ambigua]|uniref:Uncharacterized protein n=1 Tax=Actinomortierella ambigua TaxID=1343610 RepID=A0A9P6TXY6_9FUNG|nr:hypothetical protein DFQ27_009212 [Actinomortierella ambigua]